MADRWIYFVQPMNGGPIKIGTARDVADRVAALQTSHPVRLTVLATCPGNEALESWLHYRLHKFRLEGEWFEPAPEVMAEVQNALTLPQAPFRLKQPKPREEPAPIKTTGRDGRLALFQRETFPIAMKATGLDDRQFAKLANTSIDTVKKWRTGRTVPCFQKCADMAKRSRAISYWGRLTFAVDLDTMKAPENHPLLRMTPEGDAEYLAMRRHGGGGA